MLASLSRRAVRAGLQNIIETRLCNGDSPRTDDLTGTIDFALAFTVLYELPDIRQTLAEIHHALKPGGQLLIAEPKGHVTESAFAATMNVVYSVGFQQDMTPSIRRSHAAVVKKS